MPTEVTYGLADLDGQLCVTCEWSDYSEPRLYKNYWPTAQRTSNFCDYHTCTPEELPTRFEVLQSRPGEYVLRDKNDGSYFAQRYHLMLVDGGRTQSLKQTFRPYDPPKTRCKVEYRDGRWHKYTAAKGWQRV